MPTLKIMAITISDVPTVQFREKNVRIVLTFRLNFVRWRSVKQKFEVKRAQLLLFKKSVHSLIRVVASSDKTRLPTQLSVQI